MITKTCPLGHECERCIWYTRIRGYNSHNGLDEDLVDCVLKVIPHLMIHQAKVTNSVGSTLDTFKNEVIKQQGSFLGIMQTALSEPRLLEKDYAVDSEISENSH